MKSLHSARHWRTSMIQNRTSHEPDGAVHAIGSQPPAIPLWVSGFLVAGAVLLILGGTIALVNPSMLISPHDEITNGVKVYAGYVVARNIGLGLFLPLLLALRARRSLGSMLMLVGMIQ